MIHDPTSDERGRASISSPPAAGRSAAGGVAALEDEIRALRDQVRTLEGETREFRDQVKTLVRTESKLHKAQRRLDGQMTLFRKLYELGQRNNANFDLPTILSEIPLFALRELSYQRCVILLDDRNVGVFTVRAHNGYHEDEWVGRLAAASLTKDDPLLATARAQKKVFFRDDAPSDCVYAAAAALGMDRFLGFPLFTGNEQLVGILLAGCTGEQEEFYVKVDADGEAAYGLANLAAQTSAAINRCLLFRELAEERNQLDENVRRRTQELSEAYANLAKLDSLKTKFFSNVSHELRTPLTLSIGPLELMLREPAVRADVTPQLRSIYNNQLRLLKLINDLLDFSKLEAGQMTTRFALEDVAATVRSQVSMLDAAASSRGITLKLDLPADAVEIYLDSGKFEKIFMNLLSNAFKFTPDGGTIAVRLEVGDDSIRIHVRDTGIGIPEEAQSKIFDRFFQVHGSDTRKYAGTGIGLAIVKEFTELHGGSVAVTSSVGVGTTFTLTFRRGRAHIPDEALETAATVVPAEVRQQQLVHFHLEDDDVEDDVEAKALLRDVPEAPDEGGGGFATAESLEDPTVLLVDDTPDMRRFLASVLRPHFRVQMARDGVDALEKLQRWVPDIIISDVMMPRMSGRELCAAVKASPGALGRTPVILVTAKAEMAMKLVGLESGADDYLVKPFDVQELLCRARNLVTVRRQEKRLAAAHAALKDKDRRLQRDLEDARSFQQRLLPQLPDVHGLAFATEYRPLDMVGGDIFDIARIGPRRHRVFLADVTGHGIQASLRTMTLKVEYDGLRGAFDEPEMLLEALNRRLSAAYLPLELMCTACCFDIETDPMGGALVSLASAAHPPILHVAGDVWREVSVDGGFLGTPNSEIQIGALRFRLEPGDRLVAFTDGLYEQIDERGSSFDIARVAQAFAAPEQSLPRSVEGLMRAFDAFRGTRSPADDITLVALECTRP